MTTPLDELASSIGFNATAALVAWYGDSRLNVPTKVTPTHILCVIIGEHAFAKLVEDFGGTDLWISNVLIAERVARDKRIYELSKTQSTVEIANTIGLGVRRVQKILEKFFGTGELSGAAGDGASGPG